MEKKIMLGTSDAWWISRLSHRPSEPAYYIEDCRISCENEISPAQKMFKLIWARRAVMLCTFVVNPQPVAFADVVD